ncbi:hypothetical protein [Francisella sp. SYW-9]|uniref:hypothetical protein n=1 Tax=Francisella sp. SYW-9 TaxID=2610888 RepID=UPI00123CA6FE|nr:hypothetical protein [Francisella sp. SYW-9]
MIIRREKNQNYSTIANECFKDPNISARAKGIYGYIMTLPDNWKLQKTELYRHFSEGQKAIDTAFKELRDKGYISQNRIQKDNGQFGGWEYVVYEYSNHTPNSAESVKTDIAKTDTAGKAKSENRPVGNGELLNTNRLNTKKQKTNKLTNKDITNNEDQSFGQDNQLVSDSFSFFVEENKSKATSLPFGFVEASEEDKKESIQEDLLGLGLTPSQMKSVLRVHPTDVIDQAIIETHHAEVEQRINDKASQYFYGVLRNLSSEKKLA